MKRCWFGFALLLILLAGGLLATRGMEKIHGALYQTLETAAEAALREDWNRVQTDFEKARAEWEKWWHFSAAFADHEPMEEIDSLFSQAKIYATSGRAADFAAYCSRIAKLVEAIGEAHGLTFQNLF